MNDLSALEEKNGEALPTYKNFSDRLFGANPRSSQTDGKCTICEPAAHFLASELLAQFPFQAHCTGKLTSSFCKGQG